MNNSIKSDLEKPQNLPEFETEEETTVDTEYRVFLYNDDHHTFDEVIAQLIKAINCSFEKARSYAFEVHVKGQAMVYSGSIESCVKVSSILEEIALHTQIVG